MNLFQYGWKAKEKFQMLAASNELIEKHIAGDCRDDNHENNNQNQQDSDNDNDEGSAHSMSNEEKEEHFRRWEHEMQKEDERRLYEDFKKEQEELNEFKKKKSKVMNKCRKNYRKHNLNTEEGCHRAHEEFCKQANDFEAELSSSSSQRPTQSMDNIDSDDNNHKRKEQKHKAPKPQNIMMENNLNGDIVLALKMGYTNLAISLFFHSYIQEQLLLTTPLDKDGNTIAHYAVYFESYEFLEFLCHDLFRERLMELKYVLTFENHRGHSPLFYARFADDIRIQELIQSQVDLAEEIMKKTGSRTARIEKLASKIKIVTKSALSLMLSIELWDIAVTFVLGRFVFHTSFLYTFLCFQTSKYVGYLKCGIAATVGHYGFGLGFLHSVGAMILMGFLMNCCYSFDDISYHNHEYYDVRTRTRRGIR